MKRFVCWKWYESTEVADVFWWFEDAWSWHQSSRNRESEKGEMFDLLLTVTNGWNVALIK